MDWTGVGENVKDEIERQPEMNGWRGIMTSNYLKRAVRDGSVSEEEEEKIRREIRKEIKEEEVQRMTVEMAMTRRK